MPLLCEALQIVHAEGDQMICPTCGASSLERNVRQILQTHWPAPCPSGLRVLHFAPEPRLFQFIASLQPELYVFAELNSPDPRFENFSVDGIPYDSNTFDLVIANHQLESCSEPEKALAEINRVLKAEGVAVLTSTYSQLLSNTFQDDAINTPELQRALYGRASSRRLFGTSLRQRVAAHLHVPQEASASSSLLCRKTASMQPLDLARARTPAPLLSICCITYNHAPFIAQTLTNFLRQNTSFPVEIVVGEDRSTDDTSLILEAFERQYPARLKVVRNECNLGMMNNFAQTMSRCQGKYIAFCEGDDYWTDPEKLQKQVDFLEANPDYVLTYGSIQAHRGPDIEYMFVGGAKVDLPPLRLQLMPSISSLTTVFRNVLNPLPPEYYTSGVADLFLWSLLGHHGSGKFLPGILPSVYNLHQGGVFGAQSKLTKTRMRLATCYSLHLYYRRLGNAQLTEHFLAHAWMDLKNIHGLLEKSEFEAFIHTFAEQFEATAQPHYEQRKEDTLQLLQTIQRNLNLS